MTIDPRGLEQVYYSVFVLGACWSGRFTTQGWNDRQFLTFPFPKIFAKIKLPVPHPPTYSPTRTMSQPTTQRELLRLIDQAADEQWEELDLSGMGLTELPKEIGRLTGLKKLVLGKVEKWEWEGEKYVPTIITNSIAALPSELKILENLEELDLSGNPLQRWPDILFQLNPLNVLRCVSCGFSEIPAEIGQLTNLTHLYLDNNQISEIPAVLGQLT
ncbi:leucine-rich repeat domain-containing protein, partial [Alkalinema pantanalense CENA528]|uniref:leucine-rich repeat domain-containing protein n=1 Tax=Alkalinema pantanalense TaxID=1620705 RepID=UPI003D6FAF3A